MLDLMDMACGRRAFLRRLGALGAAAATARFADLVGARGAEATPPSPAATFSPSAKGGAEAVTAKYVALGGIAGVQAEAIQGFFRALAEAGVYEKMVAVYPFLGTSLASMALNAVDPADEDGAFRLTYEGPPATVRPRGITWEEGSQAITHIDFTMISGAPSIGCSFYLLDAVEGPVINNGSAEFMLVPFDRSGHKAHIQIATSSNGIDYGGDNRVGLWTMQRNDAAQSQLELYQAGRLLGSEAQVFHSMRSLGPIRLNPKGVPHAMAYAAIHQALTAAEQAAHAAAVGALMERLGRKAS